MQIKIYRYQLDLIEPLFLKNALIEKKAGFIIIINEHGQNKAWGEVAPLLGFSTEKLHEAYSQTKHFLQEQKKIFLSKNKKKFKKILNEKKLFSSVVCGLEMLYLTYNKHHLQKTILLPLPPFKICSLITNIDNNKCYDHVTNEIKIKVARDLNRAREATKINKFIEKLLFKHSKSIKVRLDANRKWSKKQALDFCSYLKNRKFIDFIEEPFATNKISEYEEFYQETKIPLALDESIQKQDYQFNFFTGLAVLVFKPMLAGGVFKMFDLAKIASKQGVETIISSAYESPLALQLFYQITSLRNSSHKAMGLDTMSVFNDEDAKKALLFKKFYSNMDVFLPSKMNLLDNF